MCAALNACGASHSLRRHVARKKKQRLLCVRQFKQVGGGGEWGGGGRVEGLGKNKSGLELIYFTGANIRR